MSSEREIVDQLRRDRESLRRAARSLRTHGLDEDADRFAKLAGTLTRVLRRANVELAGGSA